MATKIDITQVDLRRAVAGDIPRGRYPILKKCPNHQDDSESLAIYPDHIKCFGCSFSVKLRMDALAWLLELSDWREALKVASDYFFLPEQLEEIKRQSEHKVRPPSLVEVGIYERLLYGECSDRLEWLYNRTLTDESIQRARLGHNGAAFVIPVFNLQGKLVTIRYRNDDKYGTHELSTDEERGKKLSKYRGWRSHNEAYLYPLWRFSDRYRPEITLCEGELDALALWHAGAPSLTCTNGAGQQTHILDLLPKQLKHLPKRIVICGDRDAPGIEAARKTFKRAKAEYEDVIWLQWPREMGKDITEVLMKGHTYESVKILYGQREELPSTTP